MIIGPEHFYKIQTGSIINGALSLQVLDIRPDKEMILVRDVISNEIIECTYQFIQSLPNVLHVYVVTGSNDANKKIVVIGKDN